MLNAGCCGLYIHTYVMRIWMGRKAVSRVCVCRWGGWLCFDIAGIEERRGEEGREEKRRGEERREEKRRREGEGMVSGCGFGALEDMSWWGCMRMRMVSVVGVYLYVLKKEGRDGV